MNALNASILNSIVLILMSLWGYFSSETPSLTALIPLFFGVIILICFKGIKSHNKVISHIAVLLTLIVLLALFMPLLGSVKRGDAVAKLPEKVEFPCMATVRHLHLQIGQKYCVIEPLKEMIQFRKINLISDNYPIKTKFSVIFCRNLLIYMTPFWQNTIVNRLRNYLEPGGYLLLGHSEYLADKKDFQLTKFNAFRSPIF